MTMNLRERSCKTGSEQGSVMGFLVHSDEAENFLTKWLTVSCLMKALYH